MEIGVYTFAELQADPLDGQMISPEQRMRDLIEEASSPSRSASTSSASVSITGRT